MISAHPHGVQECQSPIQATLEWLVDRMPNNGRIVVRHEYAEQERFAIARHRWPMPFVKAQGRSQRHHFDGNNTNNIASLVAEFVAMADERTANFATYVVGVAFCLCQRFGLVLMSRAVVVGHHNLERLRSGEATGDECCDLRVHGSSPSFLKANMRNNVPKCKRYFA